MNILIPKKKFQFLDFIISDFHNNSCYNNPWKFMASRFHKVTDKIRLWGNQDQFYHGDH